MNIKHLAIITLSVLNTSLTISKPAAAEVSIDILVRSHRATPDVAVQHPDARSLNTADISGGEYQNVVKQPAETDQTDPLSQLQPKVPKPAHRTEDDFRLLIRL